MCSAALIASAATGIPITGPDGKELPFPFPRDRPLLIWCVGYGQTHIGDTFHRMLFRRNPELKMIRDLRSGQWRAYRPWEPEDLARASEARPMPPYIPPRMIDPHGWAWEDKAKRHFTICRLKPRPEFGDVEYGTEIHAFTSIGEPKMGDPVDLIWIDEKIKFSRHYAEWQARISDRKGRIVWSLWPGNANPAVIDLIRRAEIDQEQEKPDVQEVRLRFSSNPFIDDDEKRKRLKGWSEEERLSRDEGELVSGNIQMYPSFSKFIHATPCMHEQEDDAIDEAMRKRGGIPPEDWCLAMVVDPGHQHPGVLFLAIPPPEMGDALVVWSESYLPQSDAFQQMQDAAKKLNNRRCQYFLIDSHAARTTPMGFNRTVRQQYTEALEHAGLQCEATGTVFTMASDNEEADYFAVREALMVGPKGRPKLRVYLPACPQFAQQMEMLRKHETADGVVLDKAASGQIDPMTDCIRYGVAARLQYVVPMPSQRLASPAYTYFINEWKKSEDGSGAVRCGPAAVA